MQMLNQEFENINADLSYNVTSDMIEGELTEEKVTASITPEMLESLNSFDFNLFSFTEKVGRNM